MITISPFKAVRPEAQFARQVASRPYDVMNVKEAKTEAEGNPHSFLHITRSEIDLPAAVDAHAEEVYLKAKENLDAFLSRQVLFQENKPCYYLYRVTMGEHAQTGLVCCSSVSDYDKDRIKKHEYTRPDKELDRVNHMKHTGAQTGNVFLAMRDAGELNELIANWTENKNPVYNFTAEDGIAHAIWVISDSETIDRITAIFKDQVECTYIADGHHRAASASRVRKLLPKNELTAGFLSTIFPASELKILDYNRVVSDLNGLSENELLDKINKNFSVTRVNSKYKPQRPHHFGMYVNGTWYELTALDGTFATDPVNILDVSILQKNLLEPVLGIQDQRTDSRIDFVGGIRGLSELENRVDSGEAAIAFSIFPVTVDQLFDIADANEVMPPKSTWFEPKLRDGLLTHMIREL